MKIDNPQEQFEQQYLEDEATLPVKLAKKLSDLDLPDGGLASGILLKVAHVLFNPVSAEERFKALWDLLKGEFSHVETTKASHEDVETAIQLAFAYDRIQRDDKKRARYVKVIGNALRSEKQIEDVASFIQTLEQLNERDIIVLKVLNQIMNKEGDWKPQPNPGMGDVMKLHPSTLNARGQELANQVALALGQKVEGNAFSREQGFGICNRLQGFGLAHELDNDTRELPLTNYLFRLSVQGLRLLRLLGEDVPNFDHYFRET